MRNDRPSTGRAVANVAAAGLALVVVLALGIAVLLGSIAVFKSFHRSQRRADANNNVQVTTIGIRNAVQQARVVAAQDATVQARADQRLIEAKGIRNAQDEISATLTDKYLQHEAIQAQEKLADSPNHTTIYIPSGQNGLPLVGTVDK